VTEETILTDLPLHNDQLTALPPRLVVLPGSVWTVILQPNPQRLLAVVLPSLWNVEYHVAPSPVGAVSGGGVPVTNLPAKIHAADYPLLIGGQWWGYSATGVSVTLIEVIRREG
jgi:hypothetical protein